MLMNSVALCLFTSVLIMNFNLAVKFTSLIVIDYNVEGDIMRILTIMCRLPKTFGKNNVQGFLSYI